MQFSPAINQPNRAVEDQFSGLGVDAIEREVPIAHKLVSFADSRIRQVRLKLSPQDMQRVLVEMIQECFALRQIFGVLIKEHLIVDTHLCFNGMRR